MSRVSRFPAYFFLTAGVILTLFGACMRTAHSADAVLLPNLNKNATGTMVGSKPSLDVNITAGSITAVNPSVGTNGATAPTSSTQIGFVDGSGNLTPVTIGQHTMSASIPVAISSNQSAIPASQSGTWNINNISGTVSLPTGASTSAKQPALGTAGTASADVITVQGITSMTPLSVSAGSLPLPTGAATEATLSTLNGKFNSNYGAATGAVRVAAQLGNATAVADFGAGATSSQTLRAVLATDQSAIPVSESGTWNVGLSAGSNLVGKVGIDQTTPGTTNGVQVNAALPAGTNLMGKVGIDQTTPGTTNGTSIAQIGSTTVATGNGVAGAGVQRVTIASDNTAFATKSPLNVTGSGSGAAATVSTVATLSAPANCVGFILMNLDTSTANIRWAVGRTAATNLGEQLQPGRDTGFVPIGANVSVIAESGTQNIDIQWIAQ